MGLYWTSVDAVALAATTAKTVVELGTPSTTRAKIVEWWVEFDGTTPANTPVKIEVGRFSAQSTAGTAGTAEKYDPGDPASQLTTVRTPVTTEGAGTADDIMFHRVSPTAGLYVQYPLGREPVLAASTFWRMRCTAAQIVNVTAGVTWEE